MTQHSPTCLPMLKFLWRVLVWAIIACPVVADDNFADLGLPAPTFEGTESYSAPEPLPAIEGTPLLPLPDSVPYDQDYSTGDEWYGEPQPYPAPSVGDACSPDYWIVSSRCSVQTIHQRCTGPWELDVFHRTANGFCRSSLHEMSAMLLPHIPVCLFSHGSFVRWKGQLDEAEACYTRIRQARPTTPLQMIFFTWPSDGPYTYIPTIDVNVRGRQAEFNAFHMAHLISHIPHGCPISLVGHSHGARVVLATMELAGGGTIQGHRFSGSMGAHRYRVVLAAAAVDRHWLNPNQPYGHALNCVECLLNLRNQRDLPLAFYPLTRPFLAPALGRRGVMPLTARRIGCQSEKIRNVDVTADLGSRHLWPDYYSSSQVLTALIPYVYYF